MIGKTCLLLVSIKVEELSAHCQVFKELINFKKPQKTTKNRVFSILANLSGKQQEFSLQDYIHLSVMMQYNYCNDKWTI